MSETRERYLEAATTAFADKGFYGTSVAAIADALPYTKQALLHHFGSKEKLYGEVLKRISERLSRELDEVFADFEAPQERVEELFVGFYRSSMQHREETRLLMRELLDNTPRAEASRHWYLKPFLDELTKRVYAETGGVLASRQDAMLVVYQWLGAVCYFVVSETTLLNMYGKRAYGRMKSRYEAELRATIAARLAY